MSCFGYKYALFVSIVTYQHILRTFRFSLGHLLRCIYEIINAQTEIYLRNISTRKIKCELDHCSNIHIETLYNFVDFYKNLRTFFRHVVLSAAGGRMRNNYTTSNNKFFNYTSQTFCQDLKKWVNIDVKIIRASLRIWFLYEYLDNDLIPSHLNNIFRIDVFLSHIY